MQKKIKENIYNFKEPLHSLINHLGYVLYNIDRKTSQPIFLEGDIESITGYQKKLFVNGTEKWSDRIHKNDRELYRKEFEKILKRKKYVSDIEYRIIDKKGKTRWIRSITQNISDGTAKDKNLIQGILFEITEVKGTKKRLNESQTKLKSFFKDNPSVILIINPSSKKIISANKAACRFYGWSNFELTKMKISDINTLPENKLVEEMELARKQRKNSFLFKHRRADGSIRDVEVSSGPVMLNGKHYLYSIIKDITEKKQLEEMFKQSFLISPDSISINRIGDGIYIDINNSFTKLTGYTKEDVLGKTSVEIGIWANVEDRKNLLEHFIKGQEVKNLETQFIAKDGSIKTGLMSAIIMDVNNNKCVLSITRDITERKLAEEALKIHAQEMRWLMKSMANAFVVWDSIFDENGNYVDFKFGYFNDAYSKVSGLKLEDVQGKRISEIWPTTEQSWYDVYGEVAKTGIPKTFEMYHAPTKGIYLCNAYRPWNTSERICVVFEDVTERKVAEEALHESEERFHLIFEKSGAAMLLLEPETGKIIDANAAATFFYGYTHDELCSTNVIELNATNNIDLRILRSHSLKGTQNYFVLDQKLKNREIKTIETYASPININGKVYIFSIIHDITERIKVEQALIEAKNKAEVSEELKSAFLAQMSHEIRSPLYRILGYISLIKDFINNSNIKTEEEIKDYFGSIDLSSSRLTRTIDSILNMSELQTQSYHSSFSNVNLYDIIKRLSKEYQVQAELKNINFNFICKTKNSVVYCDEYSVTQILANLIDNALKYTKRGDVTIILNRNDRQEFFIEVRDTGIGISKDFLNQLFTPFTQEEIGYTRKFDGNGLGLALVKNYCDINNALVEVESEKEKGSVFRITFKERNNSMQPTYSSSRR